MPQSTKVKEATTDVPKIDVPQKRRGIYWLPNSLTILSLACGMYAIILGAQGQYVTACLLLLIASVLDVLDGLTATLTKSTSEFGAQLDSLCDMVSFGVAPAFLAWSWTYPVLGHNASMLIVIFTAVTALRLARFNTQVGDQDKKSYFQGLPSPAGAATVFGFIWMAETYDLDLYQPYAHWALFVSSIVAAFLMVSTIRYPGIKHLGKKKIPFVGLLSILIIFMIVINQPELVIWVMSTGYALFGIVYTLILRRQRRIERKLKNSSYKQSTY